MNTPAPGSFSSSTLHLTSAVGDLWSSLTSLELGAVDWDGARALFPLAVAGVVVWSLWPYRVVLSRLATADRQQLPYDDVVVVPSFHEDPDILIRCLATWLAQDPTEIIVVLDVADTEAYERITGLGDARVRPVLFEHAGKRSALGVGMRQAVGEILVLCDSDTLWRPDLPANVQMPFLDTEVGAVSTQQNVLERTTSVWRRIADWLVNLRYADYVPAMGRAGAVACVSGRTPAPTGRSVVMPLLDKPRERVLPRSALRVR